MADSKKDTAGATAAPTTKPEAPPLSGAAISASSPVHVATFAETASISVKAALNALLKANAPIFVCPDNWPGHEVDDIWEIEREDDQFIRDSVELRGHRTHAHGFWQAEGSQFLLSSLIQREVARAQVLKRGLDHAFFLEFGGKEISANDIYAGEAFLRTAEPLIAAPTEPMKANPVAATVTPATAQPKSTPKLSEIFSDFKTFKRGSKKAIRDTSLDEYETALEDLIFVCGDVPVDEITFERACEFRDTCQKLPTHRNKIEIFKGKSCTELLALNTSEAINIGRRTVSDRLGYLRKIYGWLVARQTVSRNPFTEVNLTFEKNPYPLLTPTDLNEIFSSALYVDSSYSQWKTTRAAHWWFPLFSLWSGARPSELAQLRVNDIQVIDGILTAEVVDDEETGQRTKTDAGRRIFPIHPKLLELGFEEYFGRIKEAGYSRVFEGIKLGERKAGEVVGKWYNERYRETHLPARFKLERKVLYCFRCTYITEALNAGIPLRDLQQMVGHEKSKMGATKEYDRGQTITALRAEIEKIQFPELDIQHLIGGWKRPNL